jgi:signal transduction histidine kinase
LDPEGDQTTTALYFDENGTIWVGIYEYGFFKSSRFIPGKPCEFSQINADVRPYCFLRDHRGQLWMGTTDNGLGKLNEQTKFIKWFRSDPDNPESLSDNYISMMYEDQRDIFWITLSTAGLNVFDRDNELFIPVRHDPEDPASIVSDKMVVVNEDRHGHMWFGSFNYGLSRLKISQGLADSIRAVFTGEISRKDLDFNFTNFKSNPFEPKSLSCDQINDMYTDESGRLWIGTTNGLNLFDETNELFYVFTTSDGLPDNCIFGILEDDHGNLWLSSRKGICKVVLKKGTGPDLMLSVQKYHKEDGIQGDIFFENTCQKTDEGWMLFGGIHGFTVFHPDSIRDNEIIPPVYITDIRINDQSVYSSEPSLLDTGLIETEKIELSYKQNFLAFEYLALNYSNASQNQYKYLMEGLDNDWVEPGTRRYAEYRDLKPGEYTFRVLGSNDDGVWNEERASIEIIIHPPWYRTLLAYILYIILVALAIFGYIQWRTYRLRKDKENLEKQVKERTKTIEEQKGEIMDANTELEEQKEELQITLDRLNETQAQLIQSEKLAALGGLVAGVAHEINTPVGISVTAASSLAEETQQMAEKYKENKISRSEFKDYLNTANQSAKLILSNMERAASMVQSFKQVSVDQSTEQKRVFKLKEYSEDVIRSMYPRLKGKKVNINLEIDDQLELNSYPGAFSQILTNLVLNSVVHGFEKMDHGNINLTAHLEKKELQMEYHDNGKGIPEQNLDKVFDPFFTTNKKAGTGLGLHIVYNIVNQKLNGSITCSSEKEKGVSFRMKIPV